MNPDKIKTITELVGISNQLKKEGKKVGLVTGCFDIVHIGHLTLFSEAKKHVDILIVGIENDETVKINKGPSRPIHNHQIRSHFLSSLETIDYIFINQIVFNYQTVQKFIHADSVKALNLYALITSSQKDATWKDKKEFVEKLNIKFIDLKGDSDLGVQSTSNIANKIAAEW